MSNNKNIIKIKLLAGLKKCRKILKSTNQCDNEICMHKLRVEIKKIKALSEFYRSTEEQDISSKIKSCFSRMYKLSGKIRDHHIAQNVLLKYKTKTNQRLNEQLQLGLDLLQSEWNINLSEFQNELVKLKNLIKQLQKDPDEHKINNWIKSRNLRLRKTMRKAPAENDLHPLRKKIKECQCICQVFLNKSDYRKFLPKHLEIIQVQIGKWHDIAVTIDLLQRLNAFKYLSKSDQLVLDASEQRHYSKAISFIKKS